MSPHRTRRRLPALVLVLASATTGVAVASAPGRPPAAPASPGWVHVQLADLVEPEQVDALAAAGLRSLQYVPANAYLAYGSAAAARRALAVAGVRSVVAVTPADKLGAGLSDISDDTAIRASVLAAAGSPALRRDLVGLGARIRSSFALGSTGLDTIEVVAPASLARRLAGHSDVLLVSKVEGVAQTEDEATAQVLAGQTVGYTAKPGYEGFLRAAKVNGDGVVVTVIDDGLDPLHPELSGRIVDKHAHGALPAQGHGTHVAGIIGGKGAAVPAVGRAKDSDGLLYGLGVAPGVEFVDINAISLDATFPPADGFGVYTKQALGSGSSLWNASWTTGEGAGVGYVANAAAFDALTRDADDTAPGNQPFTFVFSAGNSGGPEAKITAPKEAKNMITVASTIAPRGALALGSPPDDEKISSFSSRGPARDGRLLPTVSAPGENVVSARATTGSLCGTDPPLDGYALYSLCSGTSMASPQVTGAVALLTQWWRQRNRGATQSPAMSKAMLVNTAVDIGERDIPNIVEGWGRVHTGNLVDPRARIVAVDQKVVLTRRGASYGVRIAPVDPSRPVRATLTWTDAPGAPQDRRTDRDVDVLSPPALVNDLDLVVEGGGRRFLGNVFANGTSIPGGRAERLNNVENVFVGRPAGSYRVTVRAHNLPGDGVPGNRQRVDQDFALVISNARVVG